MTAPAIYLDYNATTPVDDAVLAEMWPYFSNQAGNASSPHAFGHAAREAVERARERVAALVGARSRDVVFTSGATEANNLAILGVVEGAASERRQIVSCMTEHPSVLAPLELLAKRGLRVDLCSVDASGVPDIEELRSLCSAETLLVTVMAANNETGTLAPLVEVGEIARNAGAIFHTDASQMVGKLPIDMSTVGVQLLSLSAHKFCGPKGVGALVVGRRVPLAPLLLGGGQERGLRSGTVNVVGCVGAGAAAELTEARMQVEGPRLAGLRDVLGRELGDAVPGTTVNGHRTHRLPNTLNMSFAGVDAEAIMANMPRVAVSSGSACSTVPEPSHVLLAMGLTAEAASSALRFSLGARTNEQDIPTTVDEVRRAVAAVRRRTGEDAQ
jgi:cysteine desulfurase